MGSWCILVILILISAILPGCGGQAAPANEDSGAAYTSEVLDTDYEGALDVGNQLALGTLQLEEADHTLTPEQAKSLLPLWQALRGGVTAEGEVSAVLRGIEGAMTEEQLATIADMQLTWEDMQAWMQDQELGTGGGFPGAAGDRGARATRQAQSGGEGVPPGGGVPPEMATLRAQFENMSQEEREEMRATMQAGGGMQSGRAGGGAGRVGVLIRPLIEMLTECAAGSAE